MYGASGGDEIVVVGVFRRRGPTARGFGWRARNSITTYEYGLSLRCELQELGILHSCSYIMLPAKLSLHTFYSKGLGVSLTCQADNIYWSYGIYNRTKFCVKASAVRAVMQIQWCSGMRFKMPFETEDSSRISWFMGTISSVQVADAIRWPDSPWCLL